MAAGFLMLGVFGLQVLFAHEILRYLEDRVIQKRVTLVGLVLVVTLVLISVLNGVGVNLGLANNAFIPLPVSIFVGLWLLKKKDQLLLKGEMELTIPELPTLHEQEVSIPILYVLESRLKKRFRRNES
jgi:4-amino-4-deoxy-L-arabinose transferase-like glycosyltransferase